MLSIDPTQAVSLDSHVLSPGVAPLLLWPESQEANYVEVCKPSQHADRACKNGILSHITMKKSIEDLILLQPNLVSNIEKVTDFVLELSRALRTLLAWFREYKKYEETRRIILKHSNAGDKAILDQVVAKLVLRNADEETTENGRLHPPLPTIPKESYTKIVMLIEWASHAHENTTKVW